MNEEEVKQRFIELLHQDVRAHREAAAAWEELQKQGARLEDLDGRQVATAAEMVDYYRRRERELNQLIQKVQAS